MKKTLVAAAFVLILASCSNENTAVLSQENQKTEAVNNFRQALISFNKPENQTTEQEKQAKGFPEMSDRKLEILYPAAKGLIKATGVKDEEIVRTTNNDKKATLKWALEILNDHNNLELSSN